MSLTVFGLTGGIASGKSVVAEHWRSQGLPVVDADQLARQAVAPGSPCLEQIVRLFGEEMLDAEGALERRRLGALVFGDPTQLARLNQIVHPEVRRLAGHRFAELGRAGHDIACYEVPLLYEVGLDRLYSPVVLVDAPDEVRLQRLSERDGMSREAALQRLKLQMPLDEKARRAAYVIDNSGDLRDTLRRADEVLKAIRQQLAP